jgi:hypothetical protein
VEKNAELTVHHNEFDFEADFGAGVRAIEIFDACLLLRKMRILKGLLFSRSYIRSLFPFIKTGVVESFQ